MSRRWWVGAALLIASLLCLSTCASTGTGPPPTQGPAPPPGAPPPAPAAGPTARDLAESAPVVVQGTVLRTNASDEPLLAASAATVVISVDEMFAGAEIAGDQKGSTATVIARRPDRLKTGTKAFFFGAPRFVGSTLTIADDGELPFERVDPATVTAVERGAQARRNGPLLASLAVAVAVFRGSVVAVQPLAAPGGAANRPALPPSEHDPEWQLATVRVTTALRGGTPGQSVSVVFPASKDIAWFGVPKLQAGQDAIFITHALDQQDRQRHREPGLVDLLAKQPGAQFILRPVDVLPASDEPRVRALLSGQKEAK
jgi:hypothetical protein